MNITIDGDWNVIGFEKFTKNYLPDPLLFPLTVEWMTDCERDCLFPRGINISCEKFGEGIMHFWVKIENAQQWIRLLEWWKERVDNKLSQIKEYIGNAQGICGGKNDTV